MKRVEPINDKTCKVRLRNVRLSFPSLFQKVGMGESEPKFEAQFLFPKEEDKDKNAEAVTAAIDHLTKTFFKGKKLGSDKVCLKDAGDKDQYDGYDDTLYFITARANRRPTVVDKDLSPLTEDDDKPYAGCYVNATITLWCQDNNYGKRINASLEAVQFFKDGDSFGAGGVTVENEFEAIEEDSDDIF